MGQTDATTSRATSRSRTTLGVLGAVALVGVGAAAGSFLTRDGGDTIPVTTTIAETGERPTPVVSDPLPAPRGEARPGPGDTPQDAILGFLTAEATGDLEVAYTYLSAEERAILGSPSAYVAQHADLLGRVTGFDVTGIALDGADESSATASALIGFEPTLDVVTGLVPAKAEATVPLVRDADGWTVLFSGLAMTPVLPDESEAVDDARAYVEAAVACEPPVRGYSGRLQGQASLVEDLCDASGAVALGSPQLLDDPVSIQPFLASFGDEVTVWSRVVPVTGPNELRLVLAPFGDDWTVIGALPPKT